MPKLDSGLRKKIEHRLLTGIKPSDVAREYGVCQNTASHIRDELNLPKRPHGKLIVLNDTTAICSVCRSPKPLSRFHNGGAICHGCAKNKANINLESNMKRRVSVLKKKSETKKILFGLSYLDLVRIFREQNGLCFYTEEPMIWDRTSGRNRRCLTVDRLNSAKGYTPDNVVLCCWRANTIKSDMSFDEMKKWMPSWWEKIQAKLGTN